MGQSNGTELEARLMVVVVVVACRMRVKRSEMDFYHKLKYRGHHSNHPSPSPRPPCFRFDVGIFYPLASINAPVCQRLGFPSSKPLGFHEKLNVRLAPNMVQRVIRFDEPTILAPPSLAYSPALRENNSGPGACKGLDGMGS